MKKPKPTVLQYRATSCLGVRDSEFALSGEPRDENSRDTFSHPQPARATLLGRSIAAHQPSESTSPGVFTQQNSLMPSLNCLLHRTRYLELILQRLAPATQSLKALKPLCNMIRRTWYLFCPQRNESRSRSASPDCCGMLRRQFDTSNRDS